MIIQIHTLNGIIELDTQINTSEEFTQYGLDINEYKKQDFSVNNFLLGLMGAFTPLTDYANILVFYPMIADFARAYNFEGMDIFLQGLISYSIMTIEQYNTLNSVLQQQGIDLNNL
jgi:hypothetical protein